MPADVSADQEVIAWIEAQPRQLPYSELAAACLEQFGAARALNAKQLRDYWEETHPPTLGPPALIASNPAMIAFLRDRAGRLTFTELVTACRSRFAGQRVPSRSVLHRWLSQERIRRRAVARRQYSGPQGSGE